MTTDTFYDNWNLHLHFFTFFTESYTYTQKVGENPHPPITTRVVEEGKIRSFNNK